jgi:diketogulonate reductase-like aldo/keto reductase
VLYHLEERGVEHGLVARCAELGVALVGYSPFGQGMFPDESSRGGRLLQQIADAHGVSPYAVALRFLVRQPHAFAIPKAGRLEHVEQNAAAAALNLTPDELKKIDAAFPLGRHRGLPTA